MALKVCTKLLMAVSSWSSQFWSFWGRFRGFCFRSFAMIEVIFQLFWHFSFCGDRRFFSWVFGESLRRSRRSGQMTGTLPDRRIGDMTPIFESKRTPSLSPLSVWENSQSFLNLVSWLPNLSGIFSMSFHSRGVAVSWHVSIKFWLWIYEHCEEILKSNFKRFMGKKIRFFDHD